MSAKDPTDFVCAENTKRSRVVVDKALRAHSPTRRAFFQRASPPPPTRTPSPPRRRGALRGAVRRRGAPPSARAAGLPAARGRAGGPGPGHKMAAALLGRRRRRLRPCGLSRSAGGARLCPGSQGG